MSRLTGGAQIGGALLLVEARLADKVAVRAAGMRVSQELRWAPATAVTGLVDLERARVHRLDDDWSRGDPIEGRRQSRRRSDSAPLNAFWPPSGQLRLAGFTYDDFGGAHPATCHQRLAWIRSQHRPPGTGQPVTFDAQPYEQLARVYRQNGQEADARRIAIARRSDLRQYGSLTRPRRAGNWMLDRTIKHGYQPLRAVGLLLLVYVIVLLTFWWAQHHGVIVPVKDVTSLSPPPTALTCTSAYPCFYPAGYAIDVTVPIIKVGQADNWRPDASAACGWAYLTGAWAATGLGWAFTTLAVAGYTGLIRKE